jgi:hypothetical protein
MILQQFSSYALILNALNFPGCLILWIARTGGRDLFPHTHNTELVLSERAESSLLAMAVDRMYLSHARTRPTSRAPFHVKSRCAPANRVHYAIKTPPLFNALCDFCVKCALQQWDALVRPSVRWFGSNQAGWMETARGSNKTGSVPEWVCSPAALLLLLLVVLTANHIAACCHSIVTCDVLNWPRLLNEISTSASMVGFALDQHQMDQLGCYHTNLFTFCRDQVMKIEKLKIIWFTCENILSRFWKLKVSSKFRPVFHVFKLH